MWVAWIQKALVCLLTSKSLILLRPYDILKLIAVETIEIDKKRVLLNYLNVELRRIVSSNSQLFSCVSRPTAMIACYAKLWRFETLKTLKYDHDKLCKSKLLVMTRCWKCISCPILESFHTFSVVLLCNFLHSIGISFLYSFYFAFVWQADTYRQMRKAT